MSDAVNSYIAEEHFPPAISDIRARAFRREAAQIPDYESGWEELRQAISRWGYMREAEALESMSDITREAVKRLGYQSLCASENALADRAAFRDCYRAIAQRKKQNIQLPQGLQVQYHERITSSEPLQIEQIRDGIRGERGTERTEGYASRLIAELAERLSAREETDETNDS